jgi:hypothetical protein
MGLYEAYWSDNNQSHRGENRRPYIVAACIFFVLIGTDQEMTIRSLEDALSFKRGTLPEYVCTIRRANFEEESPFVALVKKEASVQVFATKVFGETRGFSLGNSIRDPKASAKARAMRAKAFDLLKKIEDCKNDFKTMIVEQKVGFDRTTLKNNN